MGPKGAHDDDDDDDDVDDDDDDHTCIRCVGGISYLPLFRFGPYLTNTPVSSGKTSERCGVKRCGVSRNL